MICFDCGIGINIDTNRLAKTTEEIQKAIEKIPPRFRSSFSASCYPRFPACLGFP